MSINWMLLGKLSILVVIINMLNTKRKEQGVISRSVDSIELRDLKYRRYILDSGRGLE
jgi:hypothetical protein